MADNDQNDSQTDSAVATEPSLLERQSRGGDIGEGGINFQADVVLSMIPRWLRMEGFTSMVRESMGDAEAKFFAPGRGYKKEFIEVKDHQMNPAEFWHEVERFKQMERAVGGEFQWFTLASAGLHKDLHPLVNSLRRIRDPYDFYEDSQIFKNSYDDYRARVTGLGKTDEDADFLFRKVLILGNLSLARDTGKVLFKHSLNENLPYHRDLPDRILEEIYTELSTFVRGRRNQTITRNEIETSLRARVPAQSQPPVFPIHLHTAISEIETDADSSALRFEWADFFAGENRNYPPPEVWNERLVGELLETKNWILERRTTRRIYLTGNRRLSTSLAIGSIFSAVAGFSIDMQQRAEQIFATDAHAAPETPDYELQSQLLGSEKGERFIVSIGIKLNVVPEVDEYIQKQGLSDLPRLHVKGDAPIISAEQANLVTGKIKSLISENIFRSGAKQIDLFIAAPSFLALFLGHRLNAMASVQCYERVAVSQYEPTCLLFAK
jgi:SMODS-associated and fused to various effectors sensor domain